MKQKIIFLSFIFIIGLTLIALGATSTSLVIPNPLGETSDIYSLIDLITKFLIGLAIVITPIIIVYAGFVYITAAGNEEKIKTAQKVLIWALIGFALVLIARGVPALIKQFLSAPECTTDEKCDEYEKCSNQHCVDVCDGISCPHGTGCVAIGNHEHECQPGVVPQR